MPKDLNDIRANDDRVVLFSQSLLPGSMNRIFVMAVMRGPVLPMEAMELLDRAPRELPIRPAFPLNVPAGIAVLDDMEEAA